MRYRVVFSCFLFFLITLGLGYCIHWKLGSEDLSGWGSYLTGAGTILLGFAALYAAVHAVREYRARTQTEHMRNLANFAQEFYENKRFAKIRRKIDFNEFSEIKALLEKDKSHKPKFNPEEQQLFDDFTDYLNFFEMLAYWVKCGQIDVEEARAMFDYYLRLFVRIDDHTYLLEYLKEDGFENLSDLLVKYNPEKKPQ